jgi:cell division protein FtsB
MVSKIRLLVYCAGRFCMSDHNPQGQTGIVFTILVAVLYAVTGIFAYTTYFIPGYREIQKARMTVSELQQEIERYRRENAELAARIKALKRNDPAVWEEATRKYLGWVKPGEIIIKDGKE